MLLTRSDRDRIWDSAATIRTSSREASAEHVREIYGRLIESAVLHMVADFISCPVMGCEETNAHADSLNHLAATLRKLAQEARDGR